MPVSQTEISVREMRVQARMTLLLLLLLVFLLLFHLSLSFLSYPLLILLPAGFFDRTEALLRFIRVSATSVCRELLFIVSHVCLFSRLEDALDSVDF